jgi:hypothetical protein
VEDGPTAGSGEPSGPRTPRAVPPPAGPPSRRLGAALGASSSPLPPLTLSPSPQADVAPFECPCDGAAYDCRTHVPVRAPCECRRLVCRACVGKPPANWLPPTAAAVGQASASPSSVGGPGTDSPGRASAPSASRHRGVGGGAGGDGATAPPCALCGLAQGEGASASSGSSGDQAAVDPGVLLSLLRRMPQGSRCVRVCCVGVCKFVVACYLGALVGPSRPPLWSTHRTHWRPMPSMLNAPHTSLSVLFLPAAHPFWTLLIT